MAGPGWRSDELPQGPHAALAAIAALLCMLPCGCGKGTSIGAAPGTSIGEAPAVAKAENERRNAAGVGDDSGGGDEPTDDKRDVLSAKQVLQKGGICSEDREVDDPDPDTDEYLIWRMYELALADDNEESFQGFRQLFPEQRSSRELREMYWPRIRANMHKYMIEPGRPAFRICRTMPTSDGKKYFIMTNDPRQHPPPITIGESDGGKTKILALTPF